jgi:hypothetical protein
MRMRMCMIHPHVPLAIQTKIRIAKFCFVHLITPNIVDSLILIPSLNRYTNKTLPFTVYVFAVGLALRGLICRTSLVRTQSICRRLHPRWQ